MDEILVLGAGKSSGVLIDYLAKHATNHSFRLKVADASQENLDARVAHLHNVTQYCGHLDNKATLQELIATSSLVVSLLPPTMHLLVAQLCLENNIHLLTASYVSPEIKALHEQAKAKNLVFLMECGLDPGLDHMSAMKLLDELKEKGAKVQSFRSYCGGLIAPESDNNPWGYKITWNPKNVVLAGQGTAQYLDEGHVRYIPYHQLFKRAEYLFFEEYGEYEAYPNRDSLSYIETYGLQGIKTFLRGTIRKKGFCSAWHQLVALGLTDNSVKMEKANELTLSEVLSKFCPSNISAAEYLGLKEDSQEYKKLKWLGCFSDERLNVKDFVTPAEYLQVLLEKKWKLDENDKDLVLMQHQIEYELDGKKHQTLSSFSVKGNDSKNTAMSKTVGLPLAIAALLIHTQNIKAKGVLIPTIKEIYNPILKESQSNHLIFREKQES